MAKEGQKQLQSFLPGMPLPAECIFRITNAVTVIFIQRSASYHRTVEGCSWSADSKWQHQHYGCAYG